MRSLQTRLGVGLLLSLVVVFVVLWYGVSSAIRLLSEDYIASRLGHDAETLLAAISIDTQALPTLEATRVDAVYRRPFSGHYYEIRTSKTVTRSRSLWDQTLSAPLLATGEQQLTHLIGPQEQPLLMLAAGFRMQDTELTVAVAEDLTPVENNIAVFQRRFAVTALVVLVVLIAIQAIIVRSSLRPLGQLQEELRDLERGERDSLSTRVPTEVAALVNEVNHLLGVLGERLGRYRNAFGDLAHALKRPLTVLHQLRGNEVLRAHPELRDTITNQVESMQRTIDRVLQRARLAGGGLPGAHFSASEDLPALVDALAHMYGSTQIQLVDDLVDNVALRLDREDVLDLLGNLVENACQWSAARVRLSARDQDASLVFEVEDDGPGVAHAEVADLMRRGTRADETKQGHGLGLAIARDIAEHYGGTLELATSHDLGGLRAIVHIPLRQP